MNQVIRRLFSIEKFNVFGSENHLLKVSSVRPCSFSIGNYNIKGPVLVINNCVYMWNVPSKTPFVDWNTDMFSLLEYVEPTPGTL
jgi:hypothetical protein